MCKTGLLFPRNFCFGKYKSFLMEMLFMSTCGGFILFFSDLVLFCDTIHSVMSPHTVNFPVQGVPETKMFGNHSTERNHQNPCTRKLQTRLGLVTHSIKH